GDVADEGVRLLEQLERLLEVDDVDAAALGEDEAPHLRIPAAGLVAEMDSGLQELTHADDRHCRSFRLVRWSCAGGDRGGTGASRAPAPPPGRMGRRVVGT